MMLNNSTYSYKIRLNQIYTSINVETGDLKSGDLKLFGVKSDRARTFGRGRHPEVNSICFKLVNLNTSAYNKMPNIYSKPITNYFNRVVTPRDERDYQRNIEDEVRLQELLYQLSLFEEPERIEELASGGDLVQDTFVEPDSDLDD